MASAVGNQVSSARRGASAAEPLGRTPVVKFLQQSPTQGGLQEELAVITQPSEVLLMESVVADGMGM